jgi:hypothetical protein
MASDSAMRRVALAALVVIVAFVVVAFFAGSSYVRRARQVRTFANLQVICARLDFALGHGEANRKALETIVASVNGGRDAWGRRYLFLTRVSGGKLHYVIASFGSDGGPDVANPAAYFDKTWENVSGKYARDIVFRDGRSVNAAGK